MSSLLTLGAPFLVVVSKALTVSFFEQRYRRIFRGSVAAKEKSFI
jgi:hypothetical protein